MNIVLVLIDSLNRHFLSAYAPGNISTPNLDAFARRSWRFSNHFVGSLPCMPARREIYSGFKEMVWRPWGPLESFDRRLPRLLEAQGYATAIVTDHYHYWQEQANGYIQSFRNTRLVRGHETDNWKGPVRKNEPVPAWVLNMERWRPAQARAYYANVRGFTGEEDYFPARVMTGATQWLEESHANTPFFLQVESFDVHEPFDIPEPYASMYGDGSHRERYNVWPPYQDPAALARFMAQTTPEELAFIRSQYAGKLTMVDRWFGELLKKMDELALWESTVMIVTTDHGHDLGERGTFGKQYPHYDSHANIPLMVWHPGFPNGVAGISALTSTVDLFPTLLDAAGAAPGGNPHGQSLLPLINGEGNGGTREALLYGTFGQGVCATDGQWSIFKSPEGDAPQYYYSTAIFKSQNANSAVPASGSGYFIPQVEVPQWQVPIVMQPLSRENFLFNRVDDPQQAANLWDAEPRQRKRMLDLLAQALHEEGCPPEQYSRLGLR